MSGDMAMSGFQLPMLPGAPRARVADRVPVREVRRMEVRAALEWAFGVELARLDFNEFLKPSVGIEFVLMQRAMLGQEIDCSRGHSAPADDAELIAAVVRSELDWRDAVWLAELARAGMAPDPMASVVPRLQPVEWVCNRHGWCGRKVDLSDRRVRIELGVAEGEVAVAFRRSRKTGGTVREAVPFVPCRWTPSVAEIASARRTWMRWREALRRIGLRLQVAGLRWVEVTDRLPPATPWKDGD